MLSSACIICGARIPLGGGRCERHAGQAHRMGTSCVNCGRPATAGPYCAEHQPQYDTPPESERGAYRQGYRDPAYPRERQATLNRAKGRCESCGQASTLQVDHIVPLRDGGANHRSNLWALCKPCHDRKTAGDRRRRRR